MKCSSCSLWKGGYCDRCNNTGSVDCHCGGDLCVCGREEYDCPRCGGASAEPDYDHDFVEEDEPHTEGLNR